MSAPARELTVTETARLLHIQVDRVYVLIRSDVLQGRKVKPLKGTAQWRLSLESVERYMQQRGKNGRR